MKSKISNEQHIPSIESISPGDRKAGPMLKNNAETRFQTVFLHPFLPIFTREKNDPFCIGISDLSHCLSQTFTLCIDNILFRDLVLEHSKGRYHGHPTFTFKENELSRRQPEYSLPLTNSYTISYHFSIKFFENDISTMEVTRQCETTFRFKGFVRDLRVHSMFIHMLAKRTHNLI